MCWLCNFRTDQLAAGEVEATSFPRITEQPHPQRGVANQRDAALGPAPAEDAASPAAFRAIPRQR